jgi:hypothetical protein
MIESVELCEDLNGITCVEAPLEVSEALPLDWEPVVVGVAFAIQYIGFDGVLYTHEFKPNADSAVLLSSIDSDDISEETAAAISSSAALMLADPDDDYLVINNVELTTLGLKG